jgi:hypothetical protein
MATEAINDDCLVLVGQQEDAVIAALYRDREWHLYRVDVARETSRRSAGYPSYLEALAALRWGTVLWAK